MPVKLWCKVFELYTTFACGAAMEKNIRIGLLLDFYGEFLTQKQRGLMDMHYNEDLSLGEIAERGGITRQGVHDGLRRGEATLLDCERRLGLMARYLDVQQGLNEAVELLEGKTALTGAELDDLRARLAALSARWEGTNGL